jgi:hypothetical protein
MLIAASSAQAAGDVTITKADNVANCLGDRPTAGSANTQKVLIGGSLVPGGTATFEITFPFSPVDQGKPNFTIRDCIFVDDVPIVKYDITGVPPNVSPFVFDITVDIPSDLDLGSLFCNVAKTIEGPSAAQGSNRKAGPACFRIGGDVRVVKTAAGSDAPLAGATFAVSCDPPGDVPSIPPVVISGLGGATTIDGDAYVASGVAATGEIAIAGPIGTVCSITETVPPAGFDLASPATRSATIGADQITVIFVDPRTKNTTTISTVAKAATLGAAISDTATLTGATSGATGTITFKAYDTADCSNDPVFTDTAEVHGNGEYASGSFVPTAAGSYFWVAAYSGDDANKPSTGTCGDKGETSVVTAPPTSTPPSSTGAAPQGASQQPLANTGSSHVSNEMAWALALLILGAALTTTGIRRYQRKH